METKDILKSLRKSKGYSTMQDFCAAAGISFSTYQNYETGKRIPTADMLLKLADFYNVSTDYLLGRDTGKPAPFEQYAGSVNMSQFEREIVDGFFKLDSKTRDVFMDMLETAVENVKNGHSTPEQEKNEPLLMASRSADDRPPELKTLTPEQRKRLREAPDETQNPDNDL